MFHIVTGSFHPVLESSLVLEIQDLKTADPFAPLAIVVPSDVLRRRLQWLLCVEHGLALYDVHFLTFHQLALRLYDEQTQCQTQSTDSNFQLVSELTFRELLRRVLGQDFPDLKALNPSRLSPGSCAALWSTIRDLIEAMIDPSTVLQGIDEGLFEAEAKETLLPLFLLQSKILEATQYLQIGNADDLAELAISWVPNSPLLNRLRRVYYYGFYDLTQIQLSLFEAVTLTASVTVFTPLVDDPAFAFARRFYDRHLSTGVVLNKRTPSLASIPEPLQLASDRPSVKVMNAVGSEDELTFVCKEIGNLVELHGYRFEEIGVIARTLEPYQSWLDRLFEQHRIPYTSSIVLPVIHEPIVKLLLQLVDLGVKCFLSGDLLEVVRSPYYQVNRFGVRQELIHPELWQEVVQTMGIARGEDQWLRLSTVTAAEKGRVCDRVAEKLNMPINLCLESIQFFNMLIGELITDCQSLPTHGRIGELTDAFISLIRKHLDLPRLDDAKGDSDSPLYDVSLAEAIRDIFVNLKQMNGLEETITWREWASVFFQAVDEGSIPLEPGPHHGVRVLDAMAARGLPFRAVFILGLNEKVFPRYVREDPFLRDSHRRVLAETFGYKIDEKFSGYDEERLLFALLQQAAQHRLYLSYQRADEDGRPLSPSSFLRDVNRHAGLTESDQTLTLPRRFSDRFTQPLFRDSLLTREEYGLKLILEGVDPSEFLQAFDRESSLFQRGWNILGEIERNRGEIGPFDGILGPTEEYWQNLTFKGVSPTALERYAQCPFQYFVSHLLGVNVMRRQITDDLPPSVIGTLCHSVLSSVYVRLIKAGWPELQSTSSFPQSFIASTAEEVFAAYSSEYPTSHWVVWQLLKQVVTKLVKTEVEASQKDFVKNGFRPIAVEVDAEGHMELTASSFGGLKIHGRLDRLDFNDGTEKFRIIDYKFKSSSKMKSKERHLLAAGIRGHYLQPALYSFMSEVHIQNEEGEAPQPIRPERVEFVYLAPLWESVIERSAFETASWNSTAGQQLQTTLANLLTGVNHGQYLILPGEYCQHCPVSTACRRFHRPTWSRSYSSEQATKLRAIRKQEILRD